MYVNGRRGAYDTTADRRRDSGRILQRSTQQERAGGKWDSAGAKWDSAGAKWDSAGLCAGVVHVPPARRRGAGEEGEGADVRPKLRQKLPKLSETFPETSPPNLHSLSVCAAHARSGAECLWKGVFVERRGGVGSVRRHDSRALSGYSQGVTGGTLGTQRVLTRAGAHAGTAAGSATRSSSTTSRSRASGRRSTTTTRTWRYPRTLSTPV